MSLKGRNDDSSKDESVSMKENDNNGVMVAEEDDPVLEAAKTDARLHRQNLSSDKLAQYKKIELIQSKGNRNKYLNFRKLRGQTILFTSASRKCLKFRQTNGVCKTHLQELEQLVSRFRESLTVVIFWVHDKQDKVWSQFSQAEKEAYRKYGQRLLPENSTIKLTVPTHVNGAHTNEIIKYFKTHRTENRQDIQDDFGSYFLVDSCGIYINRFDHLYPMELLSEISLLALNS